MKEIAITAAHTSNMIGNMGLYSFSIYIFEVFIAENIIFIGHIVTNHGGMKFQREFFAVEKKFRVT